MNNRLQFLLLLAMLLAPASGAMAQRTAREVMQHSVGFPAWQNDPRFTRDVFTFVRIRYSGGGWGGRGGWETDFPDSDLNLSYRLQQMTSLKVDPDARVIDILDKELFDYPFTYMVEPGGLRFDEEELPVLRKYLLNGGFMMADDFWGERDWANFASQMHRVFPDREFQELPMDHPLFHCVFDLGKEKNKLQTPNIGQGIRSEYDGITWERWDARDVHVRALFDDKGRLMVVACHNTDNGDGWEREGESEYFFHEFSEKRCYPLGINILFYIMTH